jgi:hypothetical protein
MAKLLALSVLFAPLLIAGQAAGMRNPRRGLRRTVILTLLFNALYVLGLVFLFYRLL